MSDHTTKDWFGDGYTTYHSDGSTSHTTKDWFGDGSTTYHSDGSTSHTTKDWYGDGYTTYHSDGSTSHTTKDWYGDGYTTYNSGGYSGGGYYGGYSGGYSGGGYSGGYGGSYSLDPGRLTPSGIFFTVIAAGIIGFLFWWDTISFPIVLFTLWAVVLAGSIIERNRHRDYQKQDTWHTWTLLMATLLGIYLLYFRMDAPGETPYNIAHYLVPVAYMILMGLLCTRATGATVHEWPVALFVILMVAAWFMTIYTRYSGYYGLVSVVIDGICGIILIISLVTALGCIKKNRVAILPIIAVCAGVYYLGRDLTGFYGFTVIKDFIMGFM